jgi:hypothetical protein
MEVAPTNKATLLCHGCLWCPLFVCMLKRVVSACLGCILHSRGLCITQVGFIGCYACSAGLICLSTLTAVSVASSGVLPVSAVGGGV